MDVYYVEVTDHSQPEAVEAETAQVGMDGALVFNNEDGLVAMYAPGIRRKVY
jgi:hypothetical protein